MTIFDHISTSKRHHRRGFVSNPYDSILMITTYLRTLTVYGLSPITNGEPQPPPLSPYNNSSVRSQKLV